MDLLLAISVITLGSYIQSSIGFGLAIIAAPVLFFLDPAYVPAPITVSAFTLSLINAWGTSGIRLSLRGLKYAVIGRVPGSLAGVFLIVWISQDLLGLWLGYFCVTGRGCQSEIGGIDTHYRAYADSWIHVWLHGYQLLNWRATHGAIVTTPGKPNLSVLICPPFL